VVILVLQWFGRFALPVLAPESGAIGPIVGVAGGLAILVWWAFFSRAPRGERWGAVALMAVALAVTPKLVHESIGSAAMGLLYYMLAVPGLTLAFVAWAVFGTRLARGPRQAAMVAAILVACGAWTLARTYGVDGGGRWDLDWRWAESPEERFLASVAGEPSAPAARATPSATTAPETPAPAATTPAAATPAVGTPAAGEPGGASPSVLVSATADVRDAAPSGDAPDGDAAATPAPAAWPGFRGPLRDAVVRGSRIATDWSASPPVELWRRPIGPGWSSFAVLGDRLYTQEQRGDDELVSCYDTRTGEPVWSHADPARFWEAMAGAGPRGTPAVSRGRVFALGATGILNVLDADDGAVVWSRNVAEETGAATPGWGFSSSPLIVGDLVIVALSGQLAAYDATTGEARWAGAAHAESYSSPHLLTIDGVEQVLLAAGSALVSVSPADGAPLWEHAWPGFHSLQPMLTADGDVLISTSGAAGGYGLRRLAVARGAAGWSVEERWTSRGLKPYFNDFVVDDGVAFGFDGSILSAIDLTGGARHWKGGRYGNGQVLLLADQDVLLVLSERGELALVSATRDQFTELARVPAIEGKTWNHPALVGDLLLVRNGREMAAFRLPRAGG
jgi:outer membrane protein assembly factor BamB